MRCHVCNVEVGEEQRFCHQCGESLAGVTDATQELAALPADSIPAEPDAESEPRDDGLRDDELPDTQPIPAAELPDAIRHDPDLPDTQAIPASELPDAGAAPAVGSPRVGSSLFDPATAPPAAEPEWGDPLPEPGDVHFAPPLDPPTIDVAAEVVADGPAATTTIPTQPPFDAGATNEQPVVFDAEAGPLLVDDPNRFRLRPAFVFAILGMIATLMASLADVTDIRTTRVVSGIPNQLSTLADLGTNLSVAGFVGAAMMLVGALLQCFGIRWGAGMAGGAGLAVVGWAAFTLGLAEVPIDSAERITLDPATPGPFTLTVTRDLGYWLIVAVAAIGLIVFAFSLTSAGTGGRRGLNPWTAALGAVSALVVAVGPLITVGGANFDVNFGTDNLPFVFFAGRLTQLMLIAVTGVVGFLLVRTYGLGLVAGGIGLPLWMWLSSLLEIGDRPLGIAAGNLGSTDTAPHAVTTVGVASTAIMLVAATTIALLQRPPTPH